MPNFINSLDAANVHLLLANLANFKIPVYTVHDCFAATPNNMLSMEKLVKEAFIEIYFNDEGYLLKLHIHFVENILSATDQIDTTDYMQLNNSPLSEGATGGASQVVKFKGTDPHLQNIYVMNRFTKEIISIPELPQAYINKNTELTTFIKGLLKSKYFIG